MFSVLGVYSTYRLTRLYYSARTALLATVIYATSQMLFLYTNDLHTDAILTANAIFSIWQFAEFIENRKFRSVVLGFVGAGLATITKGPIGLAVPAFAVGVHLIVFRQWRTLFSPVWLLGLPVLGIILFPTLKSNFDVFGGKGIEFFFWTNNAGRISGSYLGNNSDYSFYLHTMLYIFLPWSLFALGAFLWQTRYLNGRKNLFCKRPEYYTYGAFFVYSAILSVARQKAPHYFFPMIPLLSVIVADFVNKIVSSSKLKGWYQGLIIARTIVLISLWTALFLIILFIFPSQDIRLWTLVAGCLILLVTVWRYYRYSDFGRLIFPLIISAIALNLVINIHFFPSVYQYQGTIQASYRYNELTEGEEPLYSYLTLQYETYFYPQRVAVRVSEKQMLENVLPQSGNWIITTAKGYELIKKWHPSSVGYCQAFKHKKISKMSWKFLNPSTRPEDLKTVYLIRTVTDGSMAAHKVISPKDW
jgi:4-amino-4-deoxy-L-arabinose transferase-like glycosyltransferase